MQIDNKPADQRGNLGSLNLPKIQTDTHPSNFSEKQESNNQKWKLTKIQSNNKKSVRNGLHYRCQCQQDI